MERDEVVQPFEELARSGPVPIRDLVRMGESLLARAGISCLTSLGSPHRESLYLVHHALHLRDFDPSHLDARATGSEVEEVAGLFEQRILKRIPAAYLTNEALFRGYRFYVDERVFIPRTLLGPFLSAILHEVEWENHRVLDLCTGSGAIGISIALERRDLEVDLADVFPGALDVASRNVRRFGLSHRVRCLQSDLFQTVGGPYSLIVTNPPYLTHEEFDRATGEEIRHEPRQAFVVEGEGMDVVLAILRDAPDHLTEKGTLAMEVGPSLARRLAAEHPNMPLRWLRRDGTEWAGAFTIRNGYDPPP